MARDVWDALRNGLAHIYETKRVKTNSLAVEINVSWERRAHLTISHRPTEIYVNVRTMRNLLLKAFRAEEARLRGRDRVPPRKWLEKRETDKSKDPTGWKNLFGGRK